MQPGVLALLGFFYFGSSQELPYLTDISGSCRQGYGDNFMSCVNEGLTTVPKFHERLNFTKLFLGRNEIARLESDDFINLHFLESLSMDENLIDTIEEGSFRTLSRLAELDLGFNKLTELTTGMFHGLVSLKILTLNENLLTALSPAIFHEISSLTELNLDFNCVASIEPDTFEHLRNLTTLNLRGNNLGALNASSFYGLSSLQTLNLRSSSVTLIEPGTFEGLENLSTLNLRNNQLTVLNPDIFRGLFSLETLNLGHGKVAFIEPGTFKDLKKLTNLDLRRNNLTVLRAGSFRGLHSLVSLSLDVNYVASIEAGTFNDLTNLTTLDLRRNRLTALKSDTFVGLSSVTTLYLLHNRISHIDPGTFEGLHSLSILELRSNMVTVLHAGTFPPEPVVLRNTTTTGVTNNGSIKALTSRLRIDLRFNKIDVIEPLALQGLRRYTVFYTDDWKICCIMKAAGVDCKILKYDDLVVVEEEFADDSWFLPKVEAQISPFSSCEDLMHNVTLRTFIWVLGILSVCFNATAVSWCLLSRYRNTRQALNPVQLKSTFLAVCLAVGDFCMGVFLLITAGIDHKYRGYYILQDENWKRSFLCPFAGFLSAFSSEFSVFILTVITLDRYMAIIYGTRNCSLSYLSIKVVVVVLFIVSTLLAAIPLVDSNYSNFYNKTGVCLALPLTFTTTEGSKSTAAQNEHQVWLYSFSVFIGLNSVSVALILFCYARIFFEAIKSKRQMRNTASNRESRMGRRITLIVGTDMACWVPIIILGFMSASGHQLPPTVYAWVAVFVLPINSAVNPMIYTFYTAAFLKAVNEKWVPIKNAFCTMFRSLPCPTITTRRNEAIEMA